jgi:hypothetical protein
MIFEGLREADFLEKKWSPHTKKKNAVSWIWWYLSYLNGKIS